MRHLALKVVTLVSVLGGLTPATLGDDAASTKRWAEIERTRELHWQRVEQMRRQRPTQSVTPRSPRPQLDPELQRQYQQRQRDSIQRRKKLLSKTPALGPIKPPPFNAAAAPAPDEWLKNFVTKARTATSMESLLPYLPSAEQRTLKQSQANYDPAERAERRKRLQQLDPNITEDSLTYLTNSPYTNTLNRYQRIANKIIDIRRFEVKGNKATLTVTTHADAIVNSERYPYGTAKVELVGEGNNWCLDSYNDSKIVYKVLPNK